MAQILEKGWYIFHFSDWSQPSAPELCINQKCSWCLLLNFILRDTTIYLLLPQAKNPGSRTLCYHWNLGFHFNRLITLVDYCRLTTDLLYSYHPSGSREPSFKVPSSISYLNSGLQKKTTKTFLKKCSLTRGFLNILAKGLCFDPSWGNVRSWWTLFSPPKIISNMLKSMSYVICSSIL